MGIFDKASSKAKELGEKARDFAEGHSDQINDAAKKAGDFVDKKTHHKYADKVEKAQDLIKDRTDGSGPTGSSNGPTV